MSFRSDTPSQADDFLREADKNVLPRVTQTTSSWVMPAIIVSVCLIGGLTFYGLQANRLNQAPSALNKAAQTEQKAQEFSEPLPPAPALPSPPPPPVVIAPPPPPPVIAPPPVPIRGQLTPPGLDASHVRSTTMIVDLSQTDTIPEKKTKPALSAADKPSADEQFLDRLSKSTVDTAQAEKISASDKIIPQGTIISAILETAVNSDLPGLVRAVVSSDVRSFDGTRILVPRGSRLIGQYRNGIALGQSRAFIVWTRLLRNDGVSIQLGSPSTDTLGVAGLAGKVDTHFLQRFGAATLLSVISAGLDYLTFQGRNTQVVVSSTQQANQLANIALQRNVDLPPTIHISQGAAVRVFVARDLDFSSLQGANS